MYLKQAIAPMILEIHQLAPSFLPHFPTLVTTDQPAPAYMM